LTAASIASQRSTSSDLRSRLTPPWNLVISHLPTRFSSAVGIAWPGWYWLDSTSTRAFRPFSTRSRSSGLAVQKQASLPSHFHFLGRGRDLDGP